jgi:hypothetical protein
MDSRIFRLRKRAEGFLSRLHAQIQPTLSTLQTVLPSNHPTHLTLSCNCQRWEYTDSPMRARDNCSEINSSGRRLQVTRALLQFVCIVHGNESFVWMLQRQSVRSCRHRPAASRTMIEFGRGCSYSICRSPQARPRRSQRLWREKEGETRRHACTWRQSKLSGGMLMAETTYSEENLPVGCGSAEGPGCRSASWRAEPLCRLCHCGVLSALLGRLQSR